MVEPLDVRPEIDPGKMGCGTLFDYRKFGNGSV